MTSPSRRRWIAPSLALALAAGTVGAARVTCLGRPTSTFTQRIPIIFSGATTACSRRRTTTDIAVPATGSGPGQAAVYPTELTFTSHAGARSPTSTLRLSTLTTTATTTISTSCSSHPAAPARLTLLSDADGSQRLLPRRPSSSDDEAATSMTSPGQRHRLSAYFKPTNVRRNRLVQRTRAGLRPGTTLLSGVQRGPSPIGIWKPVRHRRRYGAATCDIDQLLGLCSVGPAAPCRTPAPISVSAVCRPSPTSTWCSTASPRPTLDDIDLLLVGPGGQQSILVGISR